MSATAFSDLNNAAAEGNFGGYLDWRLENPSDDIMTQLLQAEFEDHTGVTRSLTRDEVLGYISLLAGAGNETTTKLIGHTLRTLALHPEQRRELVADPDRIPQAIEESLRFEAPSPVQAHYVAEDIEYHGEVVPAGSAMLLVNGSASRDQRQWGETAEDFDIHRKIITCRSAMACTSALERRPPALRGGLRSTRY